MNPKARRVGAKSSVVAARAKTAIQKKQRDGVPAEAIEAWAVDCLVALNVSKKDAQQIAASLVQTSLWGIDSHGVARLGHYYSRLEAGSIEPRPKIRIRRTGPCTAQVDGGHGHGIVICHRAMDEAIALARKS
ncbi:MAG TPA: Ldh family oxidoreductase, partial [Opitutus sp.]|nr:Ldh family oxidoreductase [Opitutus sp.]